MDRSHFDHQSDHLATPPYSTQSPSTMEYQDPTNQDLPSGNQPSALGNYLQMDEQFASNNLDSSGNDLSTPGNHPSTGNHNHLSSGNNGLYLGNYLSTSGNHLSTPGNYGFSSGNHNDVPLGNELPTSGNDGLSSSNQLAQSIILGVLSFMFFMPGCVFLLLAVLPNSEHSDEFKMVGYVMGPILIALGLVFGITTLVSCHSDLQTKCCCREQQSDGSCCCLRVCSCCRSSSDMEPFYGIGDEFDFPVNPSDGQGFGVLGEPIENNFALEHVAFPPLDDSMDIQRNTAAGRPQLMFHAAI